MGDDDKTAVQPVASTSATATAVVTSVKPGWKTSEFAGLVAVLLIAGGEAVQRFLAENPQGAPLAAVAAGIYGAVYAYIRMRVKTATPAAVVVASPPPS